MRRLTDSHRVRSFVSSFSTCRAVATGFANEVRRRCLACGAALLIPTLGLVVTPNTAEAVALFDINGAPTDLINEPNNFLSFDHTDITWTMTPEFLAAYPLPKQHEQVRLAFREWERASVDPLRRASSTYSYTRYGGPQPFLDLRSTVTHEIGHALGSQHTDASWFNTNPDTGMPYNRNYQPDGNGGWVAAAPLGGEIMNEGNQTGFLPNQKPPIGLRGGEYWRLVSQDELAMLDYVYNAPLDFQEVPNNQAADMVIDVFQGGECGNNLGVAGPDGANFRDPEDPTQGGWITSSSIAIRDNPASAGPVGIKSRVSSWEFTNTSGQSISESNIRTRGTDNENAISSFSSGDHAFTSIQGMPDTFPFEFEDVSFRFSDPQGGPVPNGDTVSMTLQLDVWDWIVVSTDFQATGGGLVAVPVVNVFDWLAAEPPPNPCDSDDGGLHAPPGDNILASGFQVLNAELTTIVTEVGFAPIGDLDLTGADLNSELLAMLRTLGLLETVPINPIGLGPSEEFVFVLNGERGDLPPQLINSGRFVLLDRPELMDDELLAYAITQGANGTVISFSMLNGGIIVPEPSSFMLVFLGVLAVGMIRIRLHFPARWTGPGK